MPPTLPPIRNNDPAITNLYIELDGDLRRIARRFKNPKITLIVRNPDLADGDVVLTDDDPQKAIEAIQKLAVERSQ